MSPGKARGGSSPPSQALLTPEQYLELQNSYRATIVQTLGGLFLLLGLYLTWRRVAATERQVEIAGEGQITERFTRAIDQLGSDKLEIRLGGIYALERIARDSEKDHWPIMEVLTAYVRENAPLAKDNPGPPAADIQAILTVIGRRRVEFERPGEQRLDLRSTNLSWARLPRADLSRANLSGANLSGANLSGADLPWANLSHAILFQTVLSHAKLYHANLVWANLRMADLWRADLSGATLLVADVSDALLSEANLSEANLSGAKLKGVDLSEIKGLTHAQIKSAHTYEDTILADYLKEAEAQPPQEAAGGERES